MSSFAVYNFKITDFQRKDAYEIPGEVKREGNKSLMRGVSYISHIKGEPRTYF